MQRKMTKGGNGTTTNKKERRREQQFEWQQEKLKHKDKAGAPRKSFGKAKDSRYDEDTKLSLATIVVMDQPAADVASQTTR